MNLPLIKGRRFGRLTASVKEAAVVNEADKYKAGDAGGDNVLRARDIVPSFSDNAGKGVKDASIPGKKEEKKSSGNTNPIPIETTGGKDEKARIPRFDLAEQIMAQQRKITAIRRKPPGEKAEAQRSELSHQLTGRRMGEAVSQTPEEKEIIARIVARDIARLCRRDG